MTAPLLSENPTGPECAAAIRQAAAARGVSLAQFLLPLFAGAGRISRLTELAQASHPRPHTVARIRALIAGEDLPPARTYVRSGAEIVRQTCAAEAREREIRFVDARSGGTVAHPLAAFGDRPVLHQPTAARDRRPPAPNREPCPRCNTRGDLGCRHQAPMELRHG